MTSFAKFARDEVDYPSSDGKPMAETGIHFDNMTDVVASLRQHFRNADDVYVAANMLMYYVPGNKHKHVSPDIFVVLNSNKATRDNYLIWKEGKAPDLIIELTSSSTRSEDQHKKFDLYRDVLKTKEYFLFDPKGDYLKPALQGYRLTRGRYAKIRAVKGRLPSKVLGLELEQAGSYLRLYDPIVGEWLATPAEESLQLQKAKDEGMLDVISMQLKRKPGGMDDSLQAQLAKLDATKLAALSEALLDFTTVEDLKTWLREHGEPFWMRP